MIIMVFNYEELSSFFPDFYFISSNGIKIPANLCVLYQYTHFKDVYEPGEMELSLPEGTIKEILKKLYNRDYHLPTDDVVMMYDCIIFLHKYIEEINIEEYVDIFINNIHNADFITNEHLSMVADILRLSSAIKGSKQYMPHSETFIMKYGSSIDNGDPDFLSDIFEEKTIGELSLINPVIKPKIPITTASMFDKDTIIKYQEELLNILPYKSIAYSILDNQDIKFVKTEKAVISYMHVLTSKGGINGCISMFFDKKSEGIAILKSMKIFISEPFNDVYPMKQLYTYRITKLEDGKELETDIEHHDLINPSKLDSDIYIRAVLESVGNKLVTTKKTVYGLVIDYYEY